MTPYDRVHLSRQRTADTFPLPNVLDCIRYAITELAEYDDALLRQERQGDKRNNGREHDPRSELGQALYMLLSAYIQWQATPDAYYCPFEGEAEKWLENCLYSGAIAELGKLAGDVYAMIGTDVPVYERAEIGDVLSQADDAYNSMYALAMKHKWDVPTLVDDTCTRFELKHMANPEHARRI